MDSDDRVRRALEALRANDEEHRARPHVERAVLEAFDREQRRRAVHRRAFARAAAAVLVASGVGAYLYVRHPDQMEDAAVHTTGRPLASAPAAPPVDMVREEVVQTARIRIPRSYLALLGVPIIDPDAEGTVDVEVLLGEDGQGRAIRIVR